MQKTGIEYLTHTWNPIAMRCTRVSEGCRECWHLRTADRLSKNPGLPEDERKALAGEEPFVLRERELSAPIRAKKPAVIGVQFMGDLFHEDVPDEFIDQAFLRMAWKSEHTFLVLTKRPQRISRWFDNNYFHPWTPENIPNLYLGVTVCNQQEADEKIPELLKVPGKKWLSIEPMLGPISFRWMKGISRTESTGHLDILKDISCVVLGGETGPGARPMHPDWVRSVRDQCQAAGVPYFFKQWGEWSDSISGITGTRLFEPEQLRYMNDDGTITPLGMGYQPSKRLLFRVGTKRAGRLLDGQEYNELPWRLDA